MKTLEILIGIGIHNLLNDASDCFKNEVSKNELYEELEMVRNNNLTTKINLPEFIQVDDVILHVTKDGGDNTIYTFMYTNENEIHESKYLYLTYKDIKNTKMVFDI